MFVHLTGKSPFTPLGGLMQIDEIVATAKKFGMNAVGMTDDNNLYGLFKFYKSCKKEKIKPVVGVSLNVCLNDHTVHQNNPHYKINLLVKDNEGYQNLNTLITIAQTEGKESGDSDATPKIHYSEVLKRAKGLICLSGGYEGLWNQIITFQSVIEHSPWEDLMLEFKEAFQSDFYIEIQNHGVSSELEVNVELLKMHKKHNIPVVLTHGYLYREPKQSFAKEVVNAIRDGRTVNRDFREYVFDNFETLDFENDVKFKDFLKDGNQFYFKSPEEMESLNIIKFFPELLTNIQQIIDKCNLSLNLDNPELPNFPLPNGFTTDEEYFRNLVLEGFNKRMLNIIKRRDLQRFPDEENLKEFYRKRLNYEMDMICKMGFSGYFLVVWDVCRYARENYIPMAPGRGSVAGSLVAFSLEITGIDPIAKDLLFERFLNPARVSMPDIDLDFDSNYRAKILDYTYNKYGYDYVAQIIAFTTLSAKPAVADTAKVLNLYDESIVPTTKYNEFADYIKKFISANTSIAKNIETNEKLGEIYYSNRTVKFLLETAKQIENSIRGTSMHAGGVVIGKSPIAQYVPSQKAKTKKSKEDETSDDEDSVQLEGVVIQADKKACEPLGLIKMDYLATAILTKIRIALLSINKKRRKMGKTEIDFYELCDYVQYTTAEKDPKMYEILQKGNSLMIFQCENPALGNVLTQFYPETFEDVTAILALYRPGPMENIPTYIKNKNNPDQIDFMHSDLEEVLRETFGIIVYQEQIMQLVQVWAGFSLAEADLIRRAIGKKETEVLKEEGEKFVKKSVEMGRDPQLSQRLYELIVKFADYGFNKSHAAAYAVLALVTAWLKAYYPLEYTMCSINSFSTANQKPVERISNYILNLKDMGFDILPPHVNHSEYLFCIEENKLRHGLFSIKGVQERAAKLIAEERNKHGLYKNFDDFVVRNIKAVDDEEKKDGFRIDSLDKSTLEALILVNSFDGICQYKKAELAPNADSIIKFYKKGIDDQEKRQRADQLDLFADCGIEIEEVREYVPHKVEEDYQWSYLLEQELLKLRTTYQVDISQHINKISSQLTLRENFDNLTFNHLGHDKKPHLYGHNQKLTCYGLVRAKRKMGKGNREMCYITFRDHTGIIETTLFSDQYAKYKFFLDEHENHVLVFTGKLQRTVYGKTGHESKVYNFNIEELFTLEEVLNNPTLLRKNLLDVPLESPPPETTQTRAKQISLSELQDRYNIAHIKVSDDVQLKETLKNYFFIKSSGSKDTKIVIHNYLQHNLKADVVLANLFTISLNDINELIEQGILNKRDVFVTKKRIVS